MRSSAICMVEFYQAALPEKIARFLVSITLMLSIVFPTAFTVIKMGMLFVTFLMIFSIALKRRLIMAGGLYFFSLLYGAIGFTWSMYGEMMGNPGAMSALTVMVIYPVLIPFLSSLYRQEHSLSLYRIFLACAWIIAVIDLMYVIVTPIYPGNALQNILEFLYEDWAVVDNADTYIKFTLPNVSSVIFLLPFFLSVLFFSESKKGIVGILIVVLLLLGVAMLSGRRALLLTMLLGPAIAFLITLNAARNNVKSKSRRRLWMLIITTLALLFLTYLSVKVNGLEYYFDLVNSIFDFTSNQSNLERVYQFDALMRGIVDAPLFGHGAGAVADYIRSDEMPWAYELFFLSIVFQYGIFGFLLYASGVAFICWHLISSIKKKGRSSFEFYFLSGFIAFIAATASNPYLGKFDYMWVLFIPYAIINLKLISVKKFDPVGFSRAY